MMERSDAFEDRIMQEKGDLEGLARAREFRKDHEACVRTYADRAWHNGPPRGSVSGPNVIHLGKISNSI